MERLAFETRKQQSDFDKALEVRRAAYPCAQLLALYTYYSSVTCS